MSYLGCAWLPMGGWEMDGVSWSTVISGYISARRLSRLEKLEKEAEKQRKDLAEDPLGLTQWEHKHAEAMRAEAEKFEPGNWLEDASKRAKQINLVTHAPKFTHGDAKGSGVLVVPTNTKGGYLCSASLPRLRIDVVGNAAALDVANLLLLNANGEQLAELLGRGDASPLRSFARDEKQLADWLAAFKLALESREPSSHKLAKQLYFPLGQENYHLVAPIFATSLAQALHERIDASRFGETVKAARQARKNGEPYDIPVVEYPHTAVQTFGGTKPQNVSLLNSGRRGKVYLLSSQPPRWKSMDKPPVDDHAFWSQYGRLVYRQVQQLRNFLLLVVGEDSNRGIREKRAEMVADLVSELHQLAARIQIHRAGWSRETTLSTFLAHWLDPLRDDQEFIHARERNDWQQGVGDQFATWLNRQLQHEQLQMKDTEYNVWRKIVTRELKLLKGDLEVLQ